MSSEPLAALLALLRPRSVTSKLISGAGAWSVCYPAQPTTGFCVMLEGTCFVDAHEPLTLCPGDFLLFPQTPAFTLASDLALSPTPVTPTSDREIRRGDPHAPPSMRMVGGFFELDRANAHLLIGLLPAVLHIHSSEHGAARLRRMVDLIASETADDPPGGDLLLERLAEAMLIQALRARFTTDSPQRGLLAGLADPSLSRALRSIHLDVAQRWTVADLARTAGMSRAVFAERFTRTVGMPPMQYLLAWRMSLAQQLLHASHSLTEVAHLVGYQSTSAFSTAFTRLTGAPPSAFARKPRP